MTETSEGKKKIEIALSDGEGGTVGVNAGTEWIDTVNEFVEESPYTSRSAALRSLVFLGMYTFVHGDPRTLKPEDENPTDDSEEHSPTTIRELIPEGEENAASIKTEIPEQIEEQLIDIVEEDPEIKRKGWEVYR